jgi:dTDP-glucose 4,6-dehydratase
MTIMQFAEAIARHFEIELTLDQRPLPPDDPKLRRPDIARAKEILGWQPVVAFDEGIKQTIDYFRQIVSH